MKNIKAKLTKRNFMYIFLLSETLSMCTESLFAVSSLIIRRNKIEGNKKHFPQTVAERRNRGSSKNHSWAESMKKPFSETKASQRALASFFPRHGDKPEKIKLSLALQS
jgi:hypothetical protein